MVAIKEIMQQKMDEEEKEKEKGKGKGKGSKEARFKSGGAERVSDLRRMNINDVKV